MDLDYCITKGDEDNDETLAACDKLRRCRPRERELALHFLARELLEPTQRVRLARKLLEDSVYHENGVLQGGVDAEEVENELARIETWLGWMLR